ncbi:hypothetical protein SRHO_G00292390 [Serrasalmus rhombeus]
MALQKNNPTVQSPPEMCPAETRLAAPFCRITVGTERRYSSYTRRHFYKNSLVERLKDADLCEDPHWQDHHP